MVAPFRCRGLEEPRRLLKNPADEGGDAGVADHSGHACQPLADGGGVYGGVDEEGGLDPLQGQRFCQGEDALVDVDLARAVVDLRVARDAVDLSRPDTAAERLYLFGALAAAAERLYLFGALAPRPPDLAGSPAAAVGYGEVDVLPAVLLLPDLCRIHNEWCVDRDTAGYLPDKDILLDHSGQHS